MSVFRIEFEEQIWAEVINMLADQPYKRSGAIINTLAAQIQEQRDPAGSAARSGMNGPQPGVGAS